MIGVPTGMPHTILSSIDRVDTRMADVNTMLATGKKQLNAAEKGIVTRINADISGYGAANNNITKAGSVLDVTQAALESVADILTEMKKLATQSADGTTSAGDQDKLQETFNSLLTQIDDLVSSAEIDGVNLVGTGAADIDIQVGLGASDTFTVSAQIVDAASLSIDSLNIGSTGDASASITALETAIGTVSASQSSVTANQVGLESRAKTISSQVGSLTETVNGIENANLEELQTELVQLQTQKSINYYLVGVMNSQAQSILSIMR